MLRALAERRRRTFWPRARMPFGLTLWWAVLGAALAAVAGLQAAGLALVAGMPLLARLLEWLFIGPGLRVDEDGITLVRWFHRPAFVPWEAITLTTLTRDCLHLDLDGRSLEVRQEYQRWPLLRRKLTEALVERSGGVATNDDVAELLGEEAADGLTARAQIWWLWLMGAVALAPLATRSPASAAVLMAIAAVPIVKGLLARARRWLTISSSGLVACRDFKQVRLAWSDVDGLEETTPPSSRFYFSTPQFVADRRYLLYTQQGVFEWYRADAEGEAVAEAIERVLAAREQGRDLPGESALNERSLSLAEMAGSEPEASAISVAQG